MTSDRLYDKLNIILFSHNYKLIENFLKYEATEVFHSSKSSTYKNKVWWYIDSIKNNLPMETTNDLKILSLIIKFLQKFSTVPMDTIYE